MSILFTLLALLGTGTALLFTFQTARGEEERRASRLVREIETMYTTLQTIETNQRGYLHCGRPEFLRSYNQYLDTLAAIWPRLDSLSVEPEEQTMLDSIRVHSLSFMELLKEEISGGLRRTEEFAEPTWHKDYLDGLGSAVNKFLDYEFRDMTERAAEAKLYTTLTRTAGVAGLVAATGLGIWLMLAYGRQQRHIREQVQEIDTAEESLRAKQLLMAEIHHRVKNNLTVVGSLLGLEVSRAKSDDVREALRKSQSRVATISAIHEQFYQLESYERLDTSVYVPALAQSVHKLFASEKQVVQLEVDVQPVYLNQTKAVPFALLINELMTNAYKHAFTGRSGGKIAVRLWLEGKDVVLTVQDNGIGMSLEEADVKGLGAMLVKGLARQIGGTLDIQSAADKGTTFTLRFPLADTAPGTAADEGNPA